ncbi:MAG: DUF1573 domain-containing protein [Edaphocola sp.]
MNTQLKTILLTAATLSLLTIAVIEISGISSRALYNKYGVGTPPPHATELAERNAREKQVKSLPKTQIFFPEEHFDFGKVKEGEKVRHSFKFRNTGKNPLMISDAQASCGCTVPTFSREPVMPGNEGDIVVEFNTKGRKGKNHKNVLITSNADRERVSVSFDAEVTAD